MVAATPAAKQRLSLARSLKVDLIKAWLRYINSSAFIWNQEQFDAIDPANTEHVLGLFERLHMEYEHDRPSDAAGEPSLTQMTAKTIDILSKNPEGFLLMIAGGRIDHARHEAMPTAPSRTASR